MTNREIEHIYNEHFRKIYRFFYYKILSRETAEDLTSETFMKFLAIAQNKTDIDDPVKYLYGVTKLVFLQHLKKKYQGLKFVSIETESEFGGVVDEFLEEVDETRTPEELALKYIDKLPQKQQAILRMRLLEKLSLTEICAKTGKDMNYVKTTQKRGLRNLKLLFAGTSPTAKSEAG
jgi:RNA polymerase sigma-70 factor (ECF subfamily)